MWGSHKNSELAARQEAVEKTQVIAEFTVDGSVVSANSNFMTLLGYGSDEVQGKNHTMFVGSAYADSDEYKDFWNRLNRGEYQIARYRLLSKEGKEIWVQASYNPVLNKKGEMKIIMYAMDITGLVGAHTDVAKLVKESSENIKSVAAAAEEMSASINEINRNMNLSKTAVGDIVAKINFAEEFSGQLLKTSKSMEGIVEFIRGIAEQVNLLALNATIEAARAGEAGKGFAVVASEVKNLANQTGAATDSISKEIAEMQSISTKVASSVDEAVKTADLVSEYVSSVAAALEEQSIVTKDISASTHKSLDLIGRVKQVVQEHSN
jgi:methyl-accepting chemotaxis protein